MMFPIGQRETATVNKIKDFVLSEKYCNSKIIKAIGEKETATVNRKKNFYCSERNCNCRQNIGFLLVREKLQL